MKTDLEILSWLPDGLLMEIKKEISDQLPFVANTEVASNVRSWLEEIDNILVARNDSAY